MLRDKNKKQEGKEVLPTPAESSILFDGKPDPELERMMTLREQWTPAQKIAGERAEETARAPGLLFYQQVQALLA